VHRDAVCFCSVIETAGVTMVLEILVTVSHFAGKLKYFYIATKESVLQKGNTNYICSILSKVIPIPLYNSVRRF
jgi:hypothetical protein